MSEANKTETSQLLGKEFKPGWLELVRDQVLSLRFGTILITVHEGRVVQVEKNEKLRLDQKPSIPARSD